MKTFLKMGILFISFVGAYGEMLRGQVAPYSSLRVVLPYQSFNPYPGQGRVVYISQEVQSGEHNPNGGKAALGVVGGILGVVGTIILAKELAAQCKKVREAEDAFPPSLKKIKKAVRARLGYALGTAGAAAFTAFSCGAGWKYSTPEGRGAALFVSLFALISALAAAR